MANFNRLFTAYIYKNEMVLTDKSLMVNATDEDFREVTLALSATEIRAMYHELRAIDAYSDDAIQED